MGLNNKQINNSVLCSVFPGKDYYLNLYTKESQWDPPSEPAKKMSAKTVRASHLLVKHCESRRPVNWKKEEITRTKDEALQLLLGEEGFSDLLGGESL